jgi:hypothetical protein
MTLYTARASRRKDPTGPYYVQVTDIRDSGKIWNGVTDEHSVKAWLAGILDKPECAFEMRLDYDLGDTPVAV